MARKNKEKTPKPNKQFQLIQAIRGHNQGKILGESRLYKANIKVRDSKVRKFFEEQLESETKSSILPGQLIMFNYFQPKTEEQLKYYDAMPCTIFFGVVNTKNGPRVIGFNIHYYPPKIRYELMDRIFDIFKPIYLNSWSEPMGKKVNDFNYRMLIEQLQKSKLDFGIREYIPQLMHKITPIPPMYWQKAVFTEGRFKKETREQILKYWKNKTPDISGPETGNTVPKSDLKKKK